MLRWTLILLAVMLIEVGSEKTVLAQTTRPESAIGILHPGFLVCNADKQCSRNWWLLDEGMGLRVTLTGKIIPAYFEGYLVFVGGRKRGETFEVEHYKVESSVRFGDLLEGVNRHFKENFSCLMEGDRFRGKLKEIWSGEHNEVTLIFRFYSTWETPQAYVELRYNGRTGKYLGRNVLPIGNPCQVRFW